MPPKKGNKRKVKATKRATTNDVPQLFRLNVEVGNLESAISFYTKLLGIEGRKQPGSRCYFECGPVTLQVLDVSPERPPYPAAKALDFTVNHLEPVYERAKVLHCLSASEVHDAAGGRHRCSPVGRTIVLCRGPVGESPVFRRRRDCLHRQRLGTFCGKIKRVRPRGRAPFLIGKF